MNKEMYLIFLYLTLVCSSCDEGIKNQYRKYSINISEVDCSSNETIMSFKNVYISNKKGLFEYDFKFNTKSILSENLKSAKTTYDSISISFIPQNKPLYYQFDFSGNFLKKDSIKNKLNDFIKIDSSNKQKDPLDEVINSVSEKDFSDTVFNGLKLKSYKYPQIIKDSLGNMALQLFFTEDCLLKTPFNVNNRYPKLFNKYSLAGVVFTVISANRKMIMMISDISEVTKKETDLCDKILKNISFSN